MLAKPESGVFKCTEDATAESKLNTGRPVPATEATVKLDPLNISADGFDRHDNEVAEDHEDVKHTPRSPLPPRSSPRVAVCSPTPKSSPDTVTDAYPLCGAFSSTSEATAASKLKIGRPVPDTVATDTLAARNRSPNAFDRQLSDVADTHDDEKHEPRSPPPPRSSPALAVWSATPKFRPDTVNEAYPVGGAFSCTFEAAAASKLKIG